MGSSWGCGCRTPCQDAAGEGGETAGSRGVLGQGGSRWGRRRGLRQEWAPAPARFWAQLASAGLGRLVRQNLPLALRSGLQAGVIHTAPPQDRALHTVTHVPGGHVPHVCPRVPTHSHTFVHTWHSPPEFTGSATPVGKAPRRMAQAEKGAA